MLALKNSCSEIFRCIEMFFTIQHFWETLRLSWKTECALNSLYWIHIFYHSRFLSTCSEKQSCSEISHCIENNFDHSRFLSNLCLLWKTVVLKFFTVLKYVLSFRIFEQLSLALTTEFALIFLTVLNIYLSFRMFEQLCACPEIIHCIEYIFYHSGFLRN